MNIQAIAIAAGISLALASSAGAAVTVLGSSSADLCSKAAFEGRSDSASLQDCNDALINGMLDQHDTAGTYINRGVILMSRMSYELARADFDKSIAIDPTIGEAWVNRGAVNIIDKKYQDGISDIDKGLSLGTEEPAKAYYNRAVAYEGIDDEKSAYLDYQQASTLKPDWTLPKQELLRFTVTRHDDQPTP
ncbi:MAG TPA: tetratricopeptide repeat protein [Caulobacteraceae bacterium]|jgi:tetratricopeptide (TPR) repeat protein